MGQLAPWGLCKLPHLKLAVNDARSSVDSKEGGGTFEDKGGLVGAPEVIQVDGMVCGAHCQLVRGDRVPLDCAYIGSYINLGKALLLL